MEGLERLLALEDIRLLRAIYCRSVDSHDWPRMASILTDDFLLDLSQTAEFMGGARIEPVSGKARVFYSTMGRQKLNFSSSAKGGRAATTPRAS